MMSTFPDISISTERLVLRPFDEDDIQAFTEMMNDEQVMAWTDVPQPFTEREARTWITEYAPTERTSGRGPTSRSPSSSPSAWSASSS